MKRDMELIRTILLMVEADEYQGEGGVGGYDACIVAEHVELLLDAKLVEGEVQHFYGDEPPDARISRLTWSGHEFLAAARNETVWRKVLGIVKAQGGSVPFQVMQTLLQQAASQQFGLG